MTDEEYAEITRKQIYGTPSERYNPALDTRRPIGGKGNENMLPLFWIAFAAIVAALVWYLGSGV
ncbi:hypothetical protein [Streptomyces formicae]|uniref:Uncharacterized protein n=1 Tax=Streptomyces formicae TaxID=1616117 RepID=A0ABY3WL20_9ACTN|nr:hypothetical protein [Streptomyces formicae]UNM12296.1 hypothetical protein J4032_12825 [Streptomyces formicae]